MILSTKRSNVSQWVAVHLDQFFSQLGKGMVWLIQVILMIVKFGFYDDRHKGTSCLQMYGD